MTTYKYLKDYSYYSDLYDRMTIEECKRWEKQIVEYTPEEIKLGGDKKAELENVKAYINRLALLFMKGDRFEKKPETIRHMMEIAQAKDEKLEHAREPQGIRCLKCSSLDMICTSRDLMDNKEDKEEVLFMFECKHCDKRRAYWENGKEWEHKPLCPKCHSELRLERSRKENIITTYSTCSQCDYKETDTLDLNEKKEEKVDPNFESDRQKYCLSEKEGQEYITWNTEFQELSHILKDREENKDVHEAIAKIQKLTVVELQTLLNPLIEKAGYTKLEFEKPNLQKDVVLGFSLQDAKSGRGDYDSRHDLQKLFKKALSPTNWRLMSDGVAYRLGFLQGRLRGVEGEEALRRFVENDNKEKHYGKR